MKNKKSIQKIIKVSSLTLLETATLMGSTQLLSQNIKNNKSISNDNTSNTELNNTSDKKDTRSISGTFSKQLASTEKKKIEAGTYGPRGTLLPTSDHKATYFNAAGEVIWESEKVFTSTAASQDNDQFISSVYANGKFFTLYNNEDNSTYIFLCVIDEKTGVTITDYALGKYAANFRFRGYNLINVKNTEGYIAYVCRGSTISNRYRLNIIDTKSNNVISHDLFAPYCYDQIPSIQSQYENGYIYISYIFMDKFDRNNMRLKFIRMNIINNEFEELKSFELNNFTFFDWPYIGDQTIKMTMKLVTNGDNYNVFLNFINTSASSKSIYSCEFSNETTQLNLTKTDFSNGDFDIDVNYAKVVDNSFYIWANRSWVSNDPHIIRINSNIVIDKLLMNQVNSNNLIGKDIQVFKETDSNSTMILDTCKSDYIEFINCSNGNYKFTNIPYQDTYVDPNLSSGISASGTNLAQYSPYEIAAMFNKNTQSNPVEQFIYDKRDEIFYYVPTCVSNTDAEDFVSTDTTSNGRNVYVKYISNTETSITFEFTLKTYYSNGVLVNQWYPYNSSDHKVFTITINGLTNKPKTDFNTLTTLSSTDLGYSNSTILSDVENDVKSKVEQKLKSNSTVNLPNDATFSDINLINNYDGTGAITLKPDKYYNDYGFLETNTTDKIFTINLNNFGTRQPSNFNSQTWTVTQIKLSDVGLPSENSNIKNKVNDYALTQLSIWNLPNGTTFRTELVNTNNLQGTAIVNLYANQYYDEHGVLQTSEWNKPIVITIAGFDRSSESSFDNINITATDINYDNTILPSDISDSNLQQRISNYIKNSSNAKLPSDATLTIVGSPTKDNLLGQISVVVKPDKYYDSLGVPTTNDGSKIITANISGFKTSSPTIVPITLTTQDIGLGNMSNELVENNIDNGKNKLSQYMTDNINKPNNSFVSVTFKTLDKFNGSIIYTVTLSKYYDSNGIPTGPKDYEVTLTGFLNQNKQDTIINNIVSSEEIPISSLTDGTDLANKPINDISNDQIKELVLKNKNLLFDNLPTDITNDDFIINIVRNDRQVKVVIKLKKVYDGYYQENPSGFSIGELTFTGFINQNSGNDFVNNDESSKQWYENIWIWVGAGSGILLIILIIVITIILKKIKEEKNKKQLSINRKLSTSALPSSNPKALPNQLPNSQVNNKAQGKLPIPPTNNNKPINSQQKDQKTNPSGNPKLPIPTPRAGNGQSAQKPSLIKNGQVPPKPVSVNNPKSYAPKKLVK